MSRISQQLGPKMISSNSSHSLDKLKRSDLNLKAKLETHLLSSVIRLLIQLHQLNKCCTIRLLMARPLSSIITRSKNSDKSKKKKPLTKPTSKDISNNKLVGSTWMTSLVTLILHKFCNNLLKSCIRTKQWMLISIKVREMLDHQGLNRGTTTKDIITRINTCKATWDNIRSKTWVKEDHKVVCQFHLRIPTWVCHNNQCLQFICNNRMLISVCLHNQVHQ